MVLVLQHDHANSFVPQFSHQRKPLYSKPSATGGEDGNTGKLTSEQIARGIFVDRGRGVNGGVLNSSAVNGKSEKPTTLGSDDRNTNDVVIGEASETPSLQMKNVANGKQAPDHVSSGASDDGGTADTKGPSASRSQSAREKNQQGFPAFSAFFASPTDKKSASDSSKSFTSLRAVDTVVEEEQMTLSDIEAKESKSSDKTLGIDLDLMTDDDVIVDTSASEETGGDDAMSSGGPVDGARPTFSLTKAEEISTATSSSNQESHIVEDESEILLDVKLGNSSVNADDIVTGVSDDSNGLNLTSNTSADVNGANGYDENLAQQFKEYTAVSMKELRREVEEAKLNATESDDRVAAMQQRVAELQKELDFAEEEYQSYLAVKKEESESIGGRVDELESLLQAKEDRKKRTEEQLLAAAKESQERLLKEIEEVKSALREAKADLDDEIETAAQIQARISQTEVQIEAEKSDFDDQETELLAEIEAQTSKIIEAEVRVQEESDKFEEERLSLGKMLQEQITRLAETNAKISLEQSRFVVNQAETQRNIDNITSTLRATENEIQSERNRSTEEKDELKSALKELQQNLKESQGRLESEQRQSRQVQEDLEMRSVFERVKAKSLAAELENQRKLYQCEIDGLETTSAQNRAELAVNRAELAKSLAQFAKEKDALSDEIANSKRIRKLKAKQMSQRYRDIREEMTELWQGERRKARDEQKALLDMYTTELSDLEEAKPLLEREVIEAQELTEDLRLRAAEIMQDRMSMLEEGRLSEMRFMQTVQDRNTAISALEYERNDLKDDLAERDEKLTSYKSSMRVLIGLSMKLIRKRLGAARKRLLSPFRRRGKAESGGRGTVNVDVANGKRMSIELDYDVEAD